MENRRQWKSSDTNCVDNWTGNKYKAGKHFLEITINIGRLLCNGSRGSADKDSFEEITAFPVKKKKPIVTNIQTN